MDAYYPDFMVLCYICPSNYYAQIVLNFERKPAFYENRDKTEISIGAIMQQ